MFAYGTRRVCPSPTPPPQRTFGRGRQGDQSMSVAVWRSTMKVKIGRSVPLRTSMAPLEVVTDTPPAAMVVAPGAGPAARSSGFDGAAQAVAAVPRVTRYAARLMRRGSGIEGIRFGTKNARDGGRSSPSTPPSPGASPVDRPHRGVRVPAAGRRPHRRDLVDLAQLVLGHRHVERADVLLEIRAALRPRDRDDVLAPRQE